MVIFICATYDIILSLIRYRRNQVCTFEKYGCFLRLYCFGHIFSRCPYITPD